MTYGSHKLWIQIVQLFNNICNSGRIPKDWENAQIISIFKKLDKTKYENYRGIFILTTANKLYSSILKVKLQSFAEKILGEEQCGFRKERWTIDAVFTIKQILEKRRKYNQRIYIFYYKKPTTG